MDTINKNTGKVVDMVWAKLYKQTRKYGFDFEDELAALMLIKEGAQYQMEHLILNYEIAPYTIKSIEQQVEKIFEPEK